MLMVFQYWSCGHSQHSYTRKGRVLGNKRYEFTDHLGNVRNIISDTRLSTPTGTAPNITFITFTTDDKALYNTYAYVSKTKRGTSASFCIPNSIIGSMPKTSPNDYIESTTDKYRNGFNGQEKTDDIAGAGNHNTALFWEYDTRLGRRWNVDPKPIVSISSYACFVNNPILLTDLNGDTIKVEGSFFFKIKTKVEKRYNI